MIFLPSGPLCCWPLNCQWIIKFRLVWSESRCQGWWIHRRTSSNNATREPAHRSTAIHPTLVCSLFASRCDREQIICLLLQLCVYSFFYSHIMKLCLSFTDIHCHIPLSLTLRWCSPVKHHHTTNCRDASIQTGVTRAEGAKPLFVSARASVFTSAASVTADRGATTADLNLTWLLYWLSTFLLYNYFFVGQGRKENRGVGVWGGCIDLWRGSETGVSLD